MKIKTIFKQKDELWQKINLRDKETQKLRDKASKLRQKLEKFFLNNNLFLPIEDLKKYEGEDVEEITLITDKKEQKHFFYGDIMKIEDGHFYFSDYEQGIYEYNGKDEKYHSHFHYHESQGDKIIGFRDLKIGSCFENEEIKESFMENILLKYLESDIATNLTESEEE